MGTRPPRLLRACRFGGGRHALWKPVLCYCPCSAVRGGRQRRPRMGTRPPLPDRSAVSGGNSSPFGTNPASKCIGRSETPSGVRPCGGKRRPGMGTRPPPPDRGAASGGGDAPLGCSTQPIARPEWDPGPVACAEEKRNDGRGWGPGRRVRIGTPPRGMATFPWGENPGPAQPLGAIGLHHARVDPIGLLPSEVICAPPS
jgi:hypothetical protein